MTTHLLTRVIATESALALLSSLREQHGPLLFLLSGSLNDSNAPLCYALGEFSVGNGDVYLGNLDGAPFYVGHEQFDYWNCAQLIVDAVSGSSAPGSLEFTTGKRFLTRPRQLSNDENELLEKSYFENSRNRREPH